MKAVTYRHYGSPDELHLEQAERPVPRAGEVLVKVQATSINSWEWDLLTGRPYMYRVAGFRKPKFTIPGADVAGAVVAVGAGVDRFKEGDEVFGDLSGAGWGAMAEYVAAPEARLALKSPKMTFEQAAACPQAGVLALEGLRAVAPVAAGQSVLINGGGGGAGTFAIQMAKAKGAQVTAVDSAWKQDVMKAAGADRVLDYERTDYTRGSERYDLIVDMLLTRSPFAVSRALSPGGALAVVGGPPRALLSLMIFRGFVKQKMALVIAKPSPECLVALREQFEAGEIVPLIDRTWPLEEITEAYRYFGAGKARGKVVIRVGG